MAVKAKDQVTLAVLPAPSYVRLYYLKQASTLDVPAVPTANPPAAPWSTVEPTYTEGSTDTVYTVMLTAYGSVSFEYGPVQKSVSFEAAKQAYNKADAAQAAAATADGRYTVAIANPTAANATGKPLGAVWEVRSGGTVLRKYVLTATSTWTQVKAGQDFIGDKAIGQAQIGDAAVGTLQVAQAAITTGKIADLQVDKLTATGAAKFPLAVVEKLVGDTAFWNKMHVEGAISVGGPNKVGSVLIEDGAVIAEKLASEIVLATKIQSGPSNDYHTVLDQTGLKFFSKIKDTPDPVETLRINTPGTDSEGSIFELVHPTEDTTLMAVNEAGQATFDEMSVSHTTSTENLVVSGRELSEVIDSHVPKVVLDQSLPGSSWGPTTGSNIAHYLEVGWQNPHDVPVSLLVMPVVFTVYMSGNFVYQLYWGQSLDGSQPSGSLVNAVARSSLRTGGHGDAMAVCPSYTVTVPAGAKWRARLHGYGGSLSSGTLQHEPASTRTVSIQVLQIGAAPEEDMADVKVLTTTSTATTPKKTRVKTYSGSWAQAYFVSSGAQSTSYTTRAAQGSYNGATSGAFRGAIGFPNVTSDLSGATVKKVEVYVHMAHWYWNRGGTLRLGVHGSASKPSTLGAVTSLVTRAYSGRGQGFWITLPSSTYAGFKSGSNRGVSMQAANNSVDHYGYTSAPGNQKLRITYEK